MEVRNNCSPAFTGICIKSSTMNDVQQAISRKISDMLDYTDEYVKLSDDVDVFLLPGNSEKSIIVKFMDNFSDMFYLRGKKHLQTTINEGAANLANGVDKVRKYLTDLSANKFHLPEYDETRFLAGKTDLAKLDPDAYAEVIEDFEKLSPDIGEKAAEAAAVSSYQTLKKVDAISEI